MFSSDLIIIISLVLMEWILSIDNAAVLATMVKHLKPDDQQKALKYGIIGAYLFRGIALFLASWLIKFAFLKLAGGLYLIYLAISHFMKQGEEHDNTKTIVRSFWMTVLSVEIMDMVFSIDNVFAAVAMSPKLWVVMTWVAIGILAMRFVAGQFVLLMNKYPELENSAYLVIAMLGMKLTLGFIASFFSLYTLEAIMEGHTASIITSVLTLVLFSIPFLKRKFA
jgi:YkoY family integral membrane protein